MRFHIVSLPHTNTTKDFVSCAYTEKVRRFANMMKSLGHTVYLYGGTQNEADCDEFITCISEEKRAEFVGNNHFANVIFDPKNEYWQMFNNKAIVEISKRIEQKDFICLIGGNCQKPIADFFPGNMSVEFGIGYTGVFTKYRVFESYAWMHSVYTAYKDPYSVDGVYFDAVIPGYLDADMFPLVEKKDDYYLFIGRLIERKGWRVAQEVCEALGKRFVVAGYGDFSGYGEYVGLVGAEEKAKLMGNATAVFAPTQYVEPFGNVVIEAQTCGTPTITTDWGAFTETNINGVTGYRCRTFDEFCKATEDVKNLDPKTIREMALSRYSVDVIRYEYDKYFRRLLTLWDKGWYQRS